MKTDPQAGSKNGTPTLSVVVPMYNEEENAADTARRIAEAIDPLGLSWELIPVNDGSVDRTKEVLEELARRFDHIHPVSYAPNKGRGRALRTGFKAARGDYIIATDADLSYDPLYMREMVKILDSGGADIVLASPYMPGGSTEDVPFLRLWISKLGNMVLSGALPVKIHTITCVFRGYRRETLECMELESDGKEIHLEILSKALALGWEIREIPAKLTSRKKGKSSFRFRRTTVTHLLFSFLERPMLLFGMLGLILILGGLGIGVYMFTLYLNSALNPTRPFMSLMALLVMSGLFMFSFGLVAINISLIRKEIYRLQRQNLLLIKALRELMKDRRS